MIAFAALSLFLSYWPVRNLVSRHQRMNAAFNPFHLVNTYGAFGSIGRIRHEVVIEGTDEPEITEQTVWQEYEFKGKPGDPHRLPRQWAPYHLRLDWLMWFAALSPRYARDWLGPFVDTAAAERPPTLRLLRHNPFPDSPPRYVRAQLYQYRFTTWRELRRERCGGAAPSLVSTCHPSPSGKPNRPRLRDERDRVGTAQLARRGLRDGARTQHHDVARTHVDLGDHLMGDLMFNRRTSTGSSKALDSTATANVSRECPASRRTATAQPGRTPSTRPAARL